MLRQRTEEIRIARRVGLGECGYSQPAYKWRAASWRCPGGGCVHLLAAPFPAPSPVRHLTRYRECCLSALLHYHSVAAMQVLVAIVIAAMVNAAAAQDECAYSETWNQVPASSNAFFVVGCIEVEPTDIATLKGYNPGGDRYIFYIATGTPCVSEVFDRSSSPYVAKYGYSTATNIQLGPVACGDTAGTGACCLFAVCDNFPNYPCSTPPKSLELDFQIVSPTPSPTPTAAVSPSPTPSATVTPSGSFSTGASSSISSTVSVSPSQPTTPTPSSSPTRSPSHTPSSSSSVTPSATATHTSSVTPGGVCVKSFSNIVDDSTWYCTSTSSFYVQNLRVALVDPSSTGTITVSSAATKSSCDRANAGQSCA